MKQSKKMPGFRCQIPDKAFLMMSTITIQHSTFKNRYFSFAPLLHCSPSLLEIHPLLFPGSHYRFFRKERDIHKFYFTFQSDFKHQRLVWFKFYSLSNILPIDMNG